MTCGRHRRARPALGQHGHLALVSGVRTDCSAHRFREPAAGGQTRPEPTGAQCLSQPRASRPNRENRPIPCSAETVNASDADTTAEPLPGSAPGLAAGSPWPPSRRPTQELTRSQASFPPGGATRTTLASGMPTSSTSAGFPGVRHPLKTKTARSDDRPVSLSELNVSGKLYPRHIDHAVLV